MITSHRIAFELTAPSLGYAVSVVLGNLTDRWLATAQCQGSRHIAIGATAREALTSALAPLGVRTTAILLADPVLIGASVAVLAS
jgi:hypothetical protein